MIRNIDKEEVKGLLYNFENTRIVEAYRKNITTMHIFPEQSK